MRSDDPRLQPVVWVVMLGAFVLVVASADSRGELLAQTAVFAVIVAAYALLVLSRRR